MGPSGCGKTTLLNCLSGLDEIDSGVIQIAGTDLATLSDDRKTRYRATSMGYIFQAYNLLPVLSAQENVELPLLVSGTDSKTARERAVSALSLVGLSEWKQHYPSELSGGQQQRVTIARALVNQPEIVWADEPTGNLDRESADTVASLLLTLHREQQTVLVVVTHNQAIADRFAQKLELRGQQLLPRGSAT